MKIDGDVLSRVEDKIERPGDPPGDAKNKQRDPRENELADSTPQIERASAPGAGVRVREEISEKALLVYGHQT
jgi:hypothetical protein